MRRFLKGDEGMVREVIRQLCRRTPEDGCCNYITSHTGLHSVTWSLMTGSIMRQTESAIRTVRIIITVGTAVRKDQAEKKCDDTSQKSDEECFSSASAFAGNTMHSGGR